MFKQIDPVSNFSELEEKTNKYWQENKIFEKSVDQKDSNKAYVFYDGPPFISGLPHFGHLLVSIAKDIIPRYWTMKGHRVERVWGWDAHGLTVENKVQKKLGIKNRRDIENYGLDKFTQACYEYTSEISGEWKWYIEKIGRWVDMDNAYKTIDQDYMESVMWAFKQLYDKKLVYKGTRTSLYCTTCGTPVSNFEVAMDNTYKDVEDPAVTVKFKVNSTGEWNNVNILAWTTTPWTLPSNKALVVNQDATYVLVEHEGAKYIAAKDRLEDVFNQKEFSILKEFQGNELIGLEYEPLFTFYQKGEGDFKVYSYEGMATTEEGTGIVHSAPGFGAVDTEMGQHYGLETMLTIDDEGKFIEGDAGINPFAGQYYSKANSYITADLKNRGLLFKEDTIVHRFPFHDRCDTLLIQRAQPSWFIDVQNIKDQLIENNKPINWIPKHLKNGRFLNGIQQAPDWNISRSRFWATPMPVWESEDGDIKVISSVKELEELSGQKVKDLHRPYIDEITFELNGKTYKRIPEVLDSWFEAGSMPYASIHYPFENKEKFESTFPGDFIVEYIPQTRAWFYVMHVLSTAIFGTNSFKNAIGSGTLAGSDGRKMSKTYGNYTDPKELLQNIGGDALRIYLMNSPLMVGDNANFEDMELKTKAKRVLNPLWNTLRFFVTYANANNWNKNYSEIPESDNVLDKWIIARLHETIKDFGDGLESYIIPPAVQAVEDFVDDLSRWYVRRSRDRISEGDNAALNTLHYALLELSKASAPLIPFITEQIYLTLTSDIQNEDNLDSVHLQDYPVFSPSILSSSEPILEHMRMVRELASLGNAARTEASVNLRQPLGVMFVRGVSSLPNEYVEILKDELNIKEVKFIEGEPEQGDYQSISNSSNQTIYLDKTLSPELKAEGQAREMIRKIQDLRKKQNLEVSDAVKARYELSDENNLAVEKFGDYIKDKTNALELVADSAYYVEKVQ